MLISAYLAKVDNFDDDRYQRKVIERLIKDAAMELYEFDMCNVLNKRLIEMCVQKGIIDNEPENFLMSMIMYGKKLHDTAIENFDIDDGYRPDVQAAR